MNMRLFVRNHRLARTYFDLDETPTSETIGKLFREVVEPFCRGLVITKLGGQLWLRPTGRENELQYISKDFETLCEACRRWLATPPDRVRIEEFQGWLYAADENCKVHDANYPFTFWGCEIGDRLEPFVASEG
jgi:hypothetical protein